MTDKQASSSGKRKRGLKRTLHEMKSEALVIDAAELCARMLEWFEEWDREPGETASDFVQRCHDCDPSIKAIMDLSNVAVRYLVEQLDSGVGFERRSMPDVSEAAQ